MASAKKPAKPPSGTTDVNDFMRKLDHPLKAALQQARHIILGASPTIREGIKWNSPSFCTTEWFATVNVRKDAVHVILHLGAKATEHHATGLKIKDPMGLLEWLAKDRAGVKFRDGKSVQSGKAAFHNIVRQWIAYVR